MAAALKTWFRLRYQRTPISSSLTKPLPQLTKNGGSLAWRFIANLIHPKLERPESGQPGAEDEWARLRFQKDETLELTRAELFEAERELIAEVKHNLGLIRKGMLSDAKRPRPKPTRKLE
ncbi:hypothetical protein AHiyo8_pI69290 (plasmid) [Arthrobacter sp. Hiyo8]|nr:hypothetical protein AHiyo8_pI69290 [Arthrobacter sp. Hiyo8]GAP60674.1 hypothetical protein AHiyo1_42460 [Arthrobacter sp. Hiyo1]